MSAIYFPNINPVAFTVFGFDIMWYAIAYLIGIICGYAIIRKINHNLKKPVLSLEAIDDLLFYFVLSIIIGGRLGYVLIYDFNKFLSNPIWLFKIREGGMSFHGAIVMALLAIWWVVKKHKTSLLSTLDQVCLVAPIGIFFGRIANFINGELYGTVTNVPWAIIFWFVDENPRHPSQIYEALLEGLLLLGILAFYYLRYYDYKKSSGKILALFLIFYGLFRSFLEMFREPTGELQHILSPITMGQLLSIPMVIGGIILWKFLINKKREYSTKDR